MAVKQITARGDPYALMAPLYTGHVVDVNETINEGSGNNVKDLENALEIVLSDTSRLEGLVDAMRFGLQDESSLLLAMLRQGVHVEEIVARVPVGSRDTKAQEHHTSESEVFLTKIK